LQKDAGAPLWSRDRGRCAVNAPMKPKLEPRTDIALMVLEALPGRHDLASIHPETSQFVAATFFPGEEQKLQTWIEARQGRVNLYVMPNRSRDNAPRDHKQKKEHIKEIRAVLADFDVAKLPNNRLANGHLRHEHFRRERARLRELIDRLLAETKL